MRYFFDMHTVLEIKHASFSNCGSIIPCTCVGSERFFYIYRGADKVLSPTYFPMYFV
jgi:hypothetical protein